MLFTNIFSAAACGFSLLVGVEAYDAPTKIGHDQLSPVGTILGSAGGAIRNHQPYMHIAHGCQVYTAVDKKNHYRYVP